MLSTYKCVNFRIRTHNSRYDNGVPRIRHGYDTQDTTRIRHTGYDIDTTHTCEKAATDGGFFTGVAEKKKRKGKKGKGGEKGDLSGFSPIFRDVLLFKKKKFFLESPCVTRFLEIFF